MRSVRGSSEAERAISQSLSELWFYTDIDKIAEANDSTPKDSLLSLSRRRGSVPRHHLASFPLLLETAAGSRLSILGRAKQPTNQNNKISPATPKMSNNMNFKMANDTGRQGSLAFPLRKSQPWRRMSLAPSLEKEQKREREEDDDETIPDHKWLNTF